ncbi:MAG: MATE family efflux transporter [Treponema sp.]|jgi:putative MATE family efflux protein|nr:MATE family efflux transporter [Treponema sp.]
MPKIENDLSRGPVFVKLMLFALPFLASNVVQSLYNVADMLIVGNFAGTVSMSGVNIGGQVTFILTNVVIGLCMGATVLIGQYMGLKDRGALNRVTATIITLLLMLSAFITVFMLIFKAPLLRLIQTPAEAFAESDSYLTVTVIGVVFIFGYNALSGILRGMGNSREPFYFVLVACMVNIALDLVFVAVFHWDAFGAALATVISQALSMFLCIIYMVRNRFSFNFKPSSFRIYGDQLANILRIGLPTCAQNAVTSFSFLFLTAIVNLFGVSASAAVGAVGKFNSFAFMPTMALSASIGAMAAQNIGAGRMDRAVEACRIGTGFSVILTWLFFVLVQVFPVPILSIFSRDPEMIAAGVTYLRSFSFDFLIIPFIFCISGFLIGGGHTVFTLIVSMLSAVVLRVPVCWIFGVVLNMGPFGVGLGAPVASAGTLLLIVVYMISGRWKVNAALGKGPAEPPS